MEQTILDKLIEIDKKVDKQQERIEEMKEAIEEIVVLKEEVVDIEANINDRIDIIYDLDFLDKKILNNHEKRIAKIEIKENISSIATEEQEG